MSNIEPYYKHEDIGLEQGDKYGIQLWDDSRSWEDELISLAQKLNENQVISLKLTHREALQLRWKLDKVLVDMERRVEEPLNLKQELDDVDEHIQFIRRTADSRKSRKSLELLQKRRSALVEQINEYKASRTINV